MSQPEGGVPDFNITPTSASGAGPSYAKRRHRRKSPLATLGPLLVVAVLLAGGLITLAVLKPPGGPAAPIVFSPITDQEIIELDPLTLDVTAEVAQGQPGSPRYSLVEAPEGAAIDPATGRFTWQPTEAQGPGSHLVTIRAALETEDSPEATVSFTITVAEDDQPPAFTEIMEQTVDPGQTLSLEIAATDPDEPAARVRYQLLPDAPDGATIDPNTGLLKWTPDEASAGKTHEIGVRAVEATPDGATSEAVVRVIVAALAQPEMPEPQVVEETPPPTIEPEEPGPSPDTLGKEKILELFEKRRLFHPSEYTTLRGIFAARFALAHEEEFQEAWGEDRAAIDAWLDEHVDIKEEFFTALDPAVDNVPAALALFRDMWKLSPDRLADYGNLAIAVAVTWDQEDKAVYGYGGHQKRVRAIMPPELLGPIDNFAYLVDAEQFMQGRGQLLPWEFLVHVVNHRTPVAERQWALTTLLPQRTMIGKCYSKVPYDGEMLATDGAVCRMEGKGYTLPNLLAFGGVCAHQADFASRVGKCLGVPAAYVGGENRYGDLHAWVMWVELLSVTRTGITFRLESHGRYRGDHYYVGNLKDPKTGSRITDRQLELRLQTIGLNPLAKRQADMIMASFPMLADNQQMNVTARLDFLDQVIRLCPGNEEAWRAVAAISRDGLVDKSHTKMMMRIVNGLFQTFGAFPDFTWQVFDDLIAFQDLPKQRNLLYGQLVAMYEQAGRPDLACEARLRFTDYLVEDDRRPEAVRGLAESITRFPDEGRFVPKMLDRLEALCSEIEGAETQLLNFYRQFLPMIPKKRGDRPSSYCIEMHQRAAKRFRQAGQEAAAQQLEMQAAALKSLEAVRP